MGKQEEIGCEKLGEKNRKFGTGFAMSLSARGEHDVKDK